MKKYQKALSMLLAGMLITAHTAAMPLQVTGGKNTQKIDVPVIYKEKGHYVPLRTFCEAMQYPIGWDAKTKAITVTLPTKKVAVTLGELTQKQTGYVEKDTTYVTMAWLEKALGIKIDRLGTEAAALEVAELLIEEEYATIIEMMDEVSRKMIDPAIIEQAWMQQIAVYGNVQDYMIDKVVTVPGGNEQVHVKMVLDKAHVRATIVFNSKQEVTGLRFDLYTYEQALPEGAVEKAMMIESNGYTLPGTLTLPSEEGSFPVVVLVHGSGPNDQDETIGGVKVFRDIAYGLAEQGIATLRYDKRTFVHVNEYLANPSLYNYEEEVIEDALAAIELVQGIEQVQQDAIYVLGHSLGGMSIPMIQSQDSGVAGYIMMASPARHLADLVEEQYDYLTTVQGMGAVDKAVYMQAVRTQVEAVKKLKSPKELPEIGLAGMNNKMWVDLNAYDQVAMAKEVTEPMLVVQGGRDYQVTMQDYQLWQDALSDMDNITFKAYEDLNHLMVTGKGKSVPDEYWMPNAVSQTFITDLGQWILGE